MRGRISFGMCVVSLALTGSAASAEVTVVTQPGATVVTPPSASVTTITTTTRPAVAETRISGTIARIDEPAGVIVFTDGRAFQTGPGAVILVDNRPVTLTEIRPGMLVAVSAANPVVYRNGRYALLNQGFFDANSGSSLSADAVYAGYEADTSNAAMQVQSQ